MEKVSEITLSIPAELHQQLKDKATKNQKSVEEFLTEIIKREIENVSPVYNKEDEKKVKERLRSLGYLD